MQDTLKQNPPRRAFLGEDAPKAPSLLSPIIERVGVPLIWIGVGYLLCKMTQKPRGAA